MFLFKNNYLKTSKETFHRISLQNFQKLIRIIVELFWVTIRIGIIFLESFFILTIFIVLLYCLFVLKLFILIFY